MDATELSLQTPTSLLGGRAAIEKLIAEHEIIIWVCPNGHYIALSTSGKFPPSANYSTRSKGLAKTHYERRKARGTHNHEPCPHCKFEERVACVVTGLEPIP